MSNPFNGYHLFSRKIFCHNKMHLPLIKKGIFTYKDMQFIINHKTILNRLCFYNLKASFFAFLFYKLDYNLYLQ